MIIEKEETIKGAQDIEQNLPRNTPLKFHYTLPEKLPADGMVFLIDGYGTEVDSAYNRLLRRHISKKYNLICVSVIYHAFCSRPNNGGAVNILKDSAYQLSGELLSQGHNIPFIADNVQDYMKKIASLDLGSKTLTLKAVITPLNNEYQNFGLMQAMDHLLVLQYLIKKKSLFNQKNVLLMGSSHGAYIGHMLLKIAPNTFSGLIDNSSYVQVPVHYIGAETEYSMMLSKNIKILCSVLTPWIFTDEKSNQFFSPANFAIRDMLNLEHLKEYKKHSKRLVKVQSYVSNSDPWVPIKTKSKQIKQLNNHDVSSKLTVITNKDLDGKKFKSLKHGMEAGLQEIFDETYPNMGLQLGETDFQLGTKLCLPCYDKNYHFDYSKGFKAYVTE